MSEPREVARFYRLVATDPPTLRDFLSVAARGRPGPRDPEEARLHTGISVYATEAQARRKGRASPVLGQFVAEIAFPASIFRVERTLRSAGHHTVWGTPEDLLACVQRVMAALPRE